MTPEEIRIIRTDWRSVEPVSDNVATLFYGKLFDLDPSLQGLFVRADMSEQKKKLMRMLGVIVNQLDNPALESIVRRLGARHVHYGVRPEHYATVAAALLSTLRTGLGPAFNGAHEAAWSRAYGQLVVWMLGTRPPTLPATSPMGIRRDPKK